MLKFRPTAGTSTTANTSNSNVAVPAATPPSATSGTTPPTTTLVKAQLGTTNTQPSSINPNPTPTRAALSANTKPNQKRGYFVVRADQSTAPAKSAQLTIFDEYGVAHACPRCCTSKITQPGLVLLYSVCCGKVLCETCRNFVYNTQIPCDTVGCIGMLDRSTWRESTLDQYRYEFEAKTRRELNQFSSLQKHDFDPDDKVSFDEYSEDLQNLIYDYTYGNPNLRGDLTQIKYNMERKYNIQYQRHEQTRQKHQLQLEIDQLLIYNRDRPVGDQMTLEQLQFLQRNDKNQHNTSEILQNLKNAMLNPHSSDITNTPRALQVTQPVQGKYTQAPPHLEAIYKEFEYYHMRAQHLDLKLHTEATWKEEGWANRTAKWFTKTVPVPRADQIEIVDENVDQGGLNQQNDNTMDDTDGGRSTNLDGENVNPQNGQKTKFTTKQFQKLAFLREQEERVFRDEQAMANMTNEAHASGFLDYSSLALTMQYNNAMQDLYREKYDE
jgi:hypothetical protein